MLTADREFGEMVFRQRFHMQGVTLIRLAGLWFLRKAEVVAEAVKAHVAELPHSFTVITPGMVLIRRVNEEKILGR